MVTREQKIKELLEDAKRMKEEEGVGIDLEALALEYQIMDNATLDYGYLLMKIAEVFREEE